MHAPFGAEEHITHVQSRDVNVDDDDAEEASKGV